MIRDSISNQLKKVNVADLSNYDESTHTYHIPMYHEDVYAVDNYYLIKLNDNLLCSDGLPVLVSNWNRGTYPKHKYLKISVNKELGKMIYVDSIGYDFDKKEDIDYSWSGWLPLDSIKQISKL